MRASTPNLFSTIAARMCRPGSLALPLRMGCSSAADAATALSPCTPLMTALSSCAPLMTALSSCAPLMTALSSCAPLMTAREPFSTASASPSGPRMMSSLEPPAGTIGYTFSSVSTRKSITTGRSLMAFALVIAGTTSSADSTRMPAQPMGLGPAHVVGVVRAQVHLAVALGVEQLLPLAHHAQVGVVEDRHLHGDVLRAGRDQLLRRHLEAAVAVDGPHRAVGPAHPWPRWPPARRSPSCPARRSSPTCRGSRTSSTGWPTSGAGPRRPPRWCRRACGRAAAPPRTAA